MDKYWLKHSPVLLTKVKRGSVLGNVTRSLIITEAEYKQS